MKKIAFALVFSIACLCFAFAKQSPSVSTSAGCDLNDNVPTWVPECNDGTTLSRDCIAACSEGWQEEAYIACKIYSGKLTLNEKAYQEAINKARAEFRDCVASAWTEPALDACVTAENAAVDAAKAARDTANQTARTGYTSAITIADANYLQCAANCCK